MTIQNDKDQNKITLEEDEYPEVVPIEIPVIKKVLFQFKKPVKLEFV